MVANTYPEGDPEPRVPGTDVINQTLLPSGNSGAAPDSDGDGHPDQVFATNRRVTIKRGTGTVVLTIAGHDVFDGSSVGDLNGDGRDEFTVAEHNVLGEARRWIIPGAVTNGTHDPATVGIQIDPGAVAPVKADFNHDGVTDLVQFAPNDMTRILDSRSLAAVAAPGDARSLAPVLQVPGTGYAVAAGQPALISGRVSASQHGGGRPLVDLRAWVATTTSTIAFRYASGTKLTSGAPFAAVQLKQGPAGSFLVTREDDRSGDATYVWHIDAPVQAHPHRSNPRRTRHPSSGQTPFHRLERSSLTTT